MKSSDLIKAKAPEHVVARYNKARDEVGATRVYSFSSFAAGFEHGRGYAWLEFAKTSLLDEDKQAFEEAAPVVKAHYMATSHIAGRPFKAFSAGYSLGFTEGSRAVQVTDDTMPRAAAPSFKQAREFIDEERRMECIKRTATLAEAREMWAFIKGLDSVDDFG